MIEKKEVRADLRVRPKSYDILALQKMEMSALYNIEEDYGVDYNCKNKQTLMRDILDAQADQRAV